MSTALKIHARGTLTLPKKMRERMHMREGSIVRVAEKNGSIVISPMHMQTEHDIVMEEVRESLLELRAGKASPSFKSGEDFELHMKKKRRKDLK